jgi:aldehyde:ferredoxin oxidoreductase
LKNSIFLRVVFMEKMFGYTGRLLQVDLSSRSVEETSSLEYIDDFIGGRLLAARMYWDAGMSGTGALEPENVLMLIPGPLAGTPATACSRWVMCAKSPFLYPEQYGFGNGGGMAGAAIKQAGYDGLIIRGKARGPCCLYIEDGRVELRDGAHLWGLPTDAVMEKLQQGNGHGAGIICIGPAGENLVRFAIARCDQGGAVSNGMGAVMGSKNLKAIVVRGSGKVGVAHPEDLRELNQRARSLRKGLHESVFMTEPMIEGIQYLKPTPCYGCPAGCMRASFKHSSGRVEIRKGCASTYFYTPWDTALHGRGTEIPFEATSLCDRYGLCTAELSNIIHWLSECSAQGILSDGASGLPLSQIGSLEFIEKLVSIVSARQGLGEVLSQGTFRAAQETGREAFEIAQRRITPSGYVNDAYGARVFMITSLFYATEPRNPIVQLHEVSFLLLKWALWHTTAGAMSPITTQALRKIARRVWGDEEAVDFSTYAGKALAACTIQNREHAKEAMVGCDRYWPLLDTDQQPDFMGDPALMPQMYAAVTGRAMSEPDYYRMGERSVNLQRAIMGREGRSGRGADCIGEFNFTEPLENSEGVFGMFNPDLELPGSGDSIITRKGLTLDRDAFERMKDEYYGLRGWDVTTGLQTREGLETIGLGFVCEDLEKMQLLGK